MDPGEVGASDPDGDDVSITITSVTDNEGSDPDDVLPIAADTVAVRAERDGSGDGRIYTISFIASDGQAETEGSVIVTVPHDQGGKKPKGSKKPAATQPTWGEIKKSVAQ